MSGSFCDVDGGGLVENFDQAVVVGVAVAPGDVAADHRGLLAMAGVIRAVEGEVAQRGELGLDPVQPGGVERGVGQLDVVRRRPVTDPLIGLRGQVR